MSNYPEHDKLETVKAHSQAIGEFLSWLSAQGLSRCHYLSEVYICLDCGEIDPSRVSLRREECPECDANVELREEGYYPDHRGVEKLLAEYFDIDLGKIEKEKRQMLGALRGEIVDIAS
ncbi:hypothetical protein LCGC14_1078360 [marine sediment metagenome]|uniref:Uncharacterized protein n=1 Tax=marine sediment metagenome TaxID=412755 RepID=A0A0F9MG57_9ZZZZ